MKKITKREKKASQPRNKFVRQILADPRSERTKMANGAEYIGLLGGTLIRVNFAD